MRNGSGLNYKPAKGRVDKQERQEKQKKKYFGVGVEVSVGLVGGTAEVLRYSNTSLEIK